MVERATHRHAGPPDDPDKYKLMELKSRGGEGEVWRGTIIVDSVHVAVAVKVILAGNENDLRVWHRRWLRQAELLKSLQHPGLMTLREVFVGPRPHLPGEADQADETLYLVANWVDGPTLPEWVARNPDRDVLESLRVIGSLAAAVDFLHDGSGMGQPILHRDIKPSNVIIGDAGPVLVDFGFVRAQGTDQPMTMVGSPSYIAPEVAAGHGYSKASDLYALGATAYFALTGAPPKPDSLAEMYRELNQVRGLEGREDLHDHILSMLSMDAQERPTSAIEWAQGLAAMSIVGGTTRVSARSASPPAGDQVASSVGDGGSQSKFLLRLGLAALFIVVLTGGGWMLLGSHASDPESPAAVTVSSLPSGVDVTQPAVVATSDMTTGAEETPVAAMIMPALVGLTEEEARTALADVGEVEIVVETQPDRGDVGVVLDQMPAAGQGIDGSPTVTLVVSSEYLVTVPDLIGLPRADAEASLLSLGLGAVDVVERPSARPAGTVLDQVPAASDEVSLDSGILLTVATEAKTPDLSTMSTADAIKAVEALDGTLKVEQVYDPDSATGEPLAQLPAAGEPMTEQVTLQLAVGPSVLLLEDLEALKLAGPYGFDVYFGQDDIDGGRYIHALIFRQYRSGLDSGEAEYNLSRKFDRLRATVGYSDNANSDGKMRLEVYGDGNLLFSNDYELGFAEDVLVDISGVLRLKIIATTLCCSSSDPYEVLVLGQIELLAPAEVIAEYQP